MKISVATWNINSVRLRKSHVRRFIELYRPDVLCLQEIKCTSAQFSVGFFDRLGYSHQAVNGQKGYHGVATLSRLPFGDVATGEFCTTGDARHIAVTLKPKRAIGTPVQIHNFYVPAGGDEPDPKVNRKFAHKLGFLNAMAKRFAITAKQPKNRMILVGDLNVAPHENDVWSHKKLLRVVSHTPVEVEHLAAVQASHGWIDAVRAHVPYDEKLYTWWSYRARDWRSADKGRRLDHIWVTPALEGTCKNILVAKDVRGWERPSDHAPILGRFFI